MGTKHLVYGDEARQKLLAGAGKLARAVRATLGPRGRNAILDKGWGSPSVTKDGVTVAEDIELTDPIENMGAQMLKEVASKTMLLLGMGPPPPRCWPKPFSARGLSSSLPDMIRWRFPAG